MTHAALNKDDGLIDPLNGVATEPTSPRGAVGQNFAKAVTAAMIETRRQWQDFRAELAARYGRERAGRMICAITRDDPVHECDDTMGTMGIGLVAAILAGVSLTLVAAALIMWAGRRPHGQAHDHLSSPLC